MDSDIVLDGKPSELFPPYNVPKAPFLSKKEDKQVSFFLLFREQCQDSPLYTQARSWSQAADRHARTYGQDQVNKRYGQTTKATVDPFTAVPTYSHRFKKIPRTLPDHASRPFAKEFFPPELHATLDGEDEGATTTNGPAAKRRRVGPKTLGLSNITSYKTAEELFLPDGATPTTGGLDDGANLGKALQLFNSVEKRNEDGDEEGFLSGEDDDDWVKGNGEDGDDGNVEEDDQYEDESGDDYNAEAYFDGNQDDEDYDEGGDDGGDYY
ncbi:DNA-directed RNA polymerase III subunit Rpc31-domain-containing protein [Staphylotrichum tortipilum]|uniref:DNA-directed RNA polymerase III subunit n=1 Tax=Staphylotrichum tortipilum TaxID=2831512 RepID=A0AAN6RSZ8_9PEZI|nr:DNA-directed RNA polymerase III subunit Rpc31-domain-containing protein [Staphylotrichum longicolle]